MHAETSLVRITHLHQLSGTVLCFSKVFLRPLTAISYASLYAVTSCGRLAAATDRTEPEELINSLPRHVHAQQLEAKYRVAQEGKERDHLPSVLGRARF